MKKFILSICILSTFSLFSQEKKAENFAGNLELGMRSTMSVFGHDDQPGYGTGGQFRIRFGKFINTEWFADYITTNLDGLGKRNDAHIGWSVMFYPYDSYDKVFQPYFLAGHCFDYTSVRSYYYIPTYDSRWSSAVQMGLGTSFNLELLNVSLGTQYMMHLGREIEYQKLQSAEGETYLQVGDGYNHSNGNTGLEGHLFLTLSINAKIADLW